EVKVTVIAAGFDKIENGAATATPAAVAAAADDPTVTLLPDADDDEVLVSFEVSDTGIGIAEADQRRLFEPFSQADASTTRRYGGTGLGLAISTQLVAAMGGTLDVTSQPGRGATFWFELPFRRAVDGPVVAPRSFQHLLAGLRVLVVDDNATNRLILHEQLGAWDMQPEVVEDGPSALEQLREATRQERPYDVAVLDMYMADMDGLELARRISADPELGGVKLMLLTSTLDFDPSDVTRAGIAAQLMKPVRLSQLYDSLVRLIAPTTVREQHPVQPASVTPTRGHVLVVEDNLVNQMVATGILAQLGYRADVAGNGLEALEALDRTRYAAVLMDCQMPEMDGYTATAEIRRRPGPTRDTPIIAMTAGAIEGDRERCLAAGMDDYIAKPVDPRDVDAVLTRWIGGAEGVAEAVDVERLATLRRLGPADGSLLTQMVDAFADQAVETMAAIRDAESGGDLEALQQSAHRLRGAAANLGAAALADRCLELEQIGELTGAAELISSIDIELDRASRALRAATEQPVT
ncbi:MAG: response regulator, partial [Egibacteraceae bacterium]